MRSATTQDDEATPGRDGVAVPSPPPAPPVDPHAYRGGAAGSGWRSVPVLLLGVATGALLPDLSAGVWWAVLATLAVLGATLAFPRLLPAGAARWRAGGPDRPSAGRSGGARR